MRKTGPADGSVVNRVIGAKSRYRGQLLAACRADDRRARRLGRLDQQRPDPARRRGDQDGVCPKSAWGGVKAMLHSVYDQPDADSVNAQFDKLIDTVTGPLPAVAGHLDAARADLLAFTAFPKELWRQVWSNNP